jgi:hypothetical protein
LGKWVVEREKRHRGEENAVKSLRFFSSSFFRGLKVFAKIAYVKNLLGRWVRWGQDCSSSSSHLLLW